MIFDDFWSMHYSCLDVGRYLSNAAKIGFKINLRILEVHGLLLCIEFSWMIGQSSRGYIRQSSWMIRQTDGWSVNFGVGSVNAGL
jgi:hypothetical protein